MGKLTVEDANKELERLSSTFSNKNISLKDKEDLLRGIIERLDVSTHGSTTVLYSGSIEIELGRHGRGTGHLVNELKNNANIRLLDNTEACKFLDLSADSGNNTLGDALRAIFGDNPRDEGSKANQFLYGNNTTPRTANGAWDIISRNFAKGASGNVVAIVPFAQADRVFGATELKELLNNSNVTSINGIDKEALLSLSKNFPPTAKDIERIFNTIKFTSRYQMVASGLISLDIEGNNIKHKLHTENNVRKEFLKSTSMNLDDYLKINTDGSKAITRYMGNLKKVNEKEYHNINQVIKDIEHNIKLIETPGKPSVKGKIAKAFAGLAAVAGIIGFIMEAHEAAKIAEEEGSEASKKYIKKWASGALGSTIGSVIGGYAGTVASAALVGAGLTIAAPITGALVLGAAILGGIYGDEFARELYELTGDVDENGRMDILDRIETLAIGQDIKLNEIPEEFKKKAVTLHDGEISLDSLIENAYKDAAYRYALRDLNVFIAKGADYKYYNANDSLDLWSKEHPGGMTESYIRDRSAMLLLLLQYLKNGLKLSRDLVDGTVKGDWDYLDYGKKPFQGDDKRPLELSIDGQGIMTDNHRIAFGTAIINKRDILEGSKREDHLYGLGGDDELIGRGGSDYLEGGTGHDTYVISSKDDGIDTIFDADGSGVLKVDEQELTNLVFTYPSDSDGIPDTLYARDKKYRFRRIAGDTWEFAILTKNSNYKTLAHIQNWENGNLDIHIRKEIKEPDNVKWDPDHSNDNTFYSYDAGGASAGVHVHGSNLRSSVFTGSIYDDTFATGEGALHYVNTAAGNDTVIGGGGREFIRAGFNRYMTPDEDGKTNDSDTVYGGGNTDIIAGGGGKDTLWAGEKDEDYKTPVSFDKGDWRGDWISGQHNDDTIHGSNKDDLLFGGGGNDTVSAGAGDDIVLGDANYLPSMRSIMIEGQEVNWKSNKTYGAGIGVPDHNNFEWEKTDTGTPPDKERVFLDFGRTRIILKNGIRLNSNESVQVDEKENYDDTIDGGAGNDWIDAQRGNDSITGGMGSDYMRGGEGADAYFISRADLRPEEGGDAVPTDTIDDDGTGDRTASGGNHDTVYLDGQNMAKMLWLRDGDKNIWNTAYGWRISYSGSTLQITHKDEVGRINVLNFANGDYGLHLSGLSDNGGNPPNPQPDPNPPTPPTPPTKRPPKTGKAVAAQKVNEKSPLNFALPDSAFTNPDNVALNYTATLADGKALPKWLHFDAAKRTFSGTPGNDDVGNLSIRVTANDGRGGSAAQNFALEVVNVNDAPQIGATLANQQGTGDKPWQYRLPTNAFRDIDKGDVLTLSAKLDNGQPLPSWLKFDGKTGQFSGTLPSSEQAGTYRIAVTATDKAGAQARQAFNLMIAAVPLNRIQGTAGIDKLQGTDGADYISGYAGNDRLEGKDGNDIIEGGLDNDTLVGGKGDDIYRFSGQFGNDGIHNFDIANYDSRTDRCDIIEFTDRKRSDVTIMRIGNNLLLRTQDGQSVSVYDNFSNKGKNSHYINFIRFSDMTLSADDIKAILQNGTSGDDHLYAKPEGSVLYAGAGNDTIIGNIGNDNLFGEDGNDTLRGNAGDDYLHGEDGNDALYGDAGKDYLDGGNGNDKLYGGADNDRLFGDRGNDVLFGGDGDDTLDGSDGDDLLYGEAGNDELFGSSGNDVLNGGTGNDKLSGYKGNDIYQFSGNFGQDIIQNKNNQNMLFGSQYDRIDFTDLQQQDLIFRRSGNNLLLVSKKHANNQVTVLDHFRDNGKTAARIDEIRFADGSRLDYDAINKLVQQPAGNLPRANLVQDRYAANAARQAQVLTQAMAASGAQPLDNLMTPDNPPLMPPLLSNLKP